MLNTFPFHSQLRHWPSRVVVLGLLAGGSAGVLVIYLISAPLSGPAPAREAINLLPMPADDPRPNAGTAVVRAAPFEFPIGINPGSLVSAQEDGAGSSSPEAWLTWLQDAMRKAPGATLATVQALPDPELRQRLLLAAVKIWAATEGPSALGWTLAQPVGLRDLLLAAAAQGMAGDPVLSVALGRELLARDTEAGAIFGGALLSGLAASGQHLAAVQFAAAIPGEMGEGWLAMALRGWVEAQPGAAAQALRTVTDPARHRVAFNAVMTGWVVREPAGLANYMVTLPAGEDRTQAFNIMLDQWSRTDAQALGEWLNRAMTSGLNLTATEFDQLAEALATRTDAAQRPPEVARAWAGLIANPTARARSFAQIDRHEHPVPRVESTEE